MGKEPRWGDKVYIEERFRVHKRRPEGKIIHLDYDENEITVEFSDGDCESYHPEIFTGMWTDKFEGLWRIDMN